MSIVHPPPFDVHTPLIPSDLEWLLGGEPDFSDLDGDGPPAVLTIVAVEAAPLYGEPTDFHDYIIGEATRFMARRADGQDDETESLPDFMARSEPIVSLGVFLGLELQAMAREVRFHHAVSPAGWWAIQKAGPISRLDEVTSPGVDAPRSMLARAIDTEIAWYLQEDSLAARAIAWRLRQLADEADVLGSDSVPEYYIDEAAFRMAAFQVFIDDEAREEAKAEAALGL
jgi:hypothetical protein